MKLVEFIDFKLPWSAKSRVCNVLKNVQEEKFFIVVGRRRILERPGKGISFFFRSKGGTESGTLRISTSKIKFTYLRRCHSSPSESVDGESLKNH